MQAMRIDWKVPPPKGEVVPHKRPEWLPEGWNYWAMYDGGQLVEIAETGIINDCDEQTFVHLAGRNQEPEVGDLFLEDHAKYGPRAEGEWTLELLKEKYPGEWYWVCFGRDDADRLPLDVDFSSKMVDLPGFVALSEWSGRWPLIQIWHLATRTLLAEVWP